MENNSPKQVLLKWVEAMNSHDVDAATSVYHEDATNLQVAIGKPLVGKEAIRKDFADFFKNIPMLRDKFVIEWMIDFDPR